jgi:hypothetical protein
MTFRGDWDSTQAYRERDVVVHRGESWLALRAGSALEPNPGRPADWARLAARGETGAQGLQGDRGPQGPPGITTVVGGGMGTGGALSTTGPTYLGMFVSSAYFTGAPAEAAQVLPIGGTLSSLHVRLRSEASTGLGSYTFTVLRDPTGVGNAFAPTGITCTITGTGVACGDTVRTQLFRAGDLIVIRATPAGPVFSVQMQWTARFAPVP